MQHPATVPDEIPLVRTRGYRLLEMLPATLTWGSFALITILSFTNPFLVASLILIYVIYWFSRTVIMSAHLIFSFLAYRQAIAKDWLALLESDERTKNGWQDLWHVVIVANSKEDLEIVDSTFETLTRSNYPLDRIIVILATEGRYPETGRPNSAALLQKFGQTFRRVLWMEHPDGLANEVRGKGGNITYALKTALPELEKLGLDPDKTLVTTLDADNQPHRQYFAVLAHTYLTTPEPVYKSYQPLPMFFNNIWFVPFVIRSISVGSAFWQMIEATRPYRLRTFSAHAQTLALLLKTNFWSTRTIVEDGHQYWRSFFATNGVHQVVPMFIPVFQDAVLSPNGDLMTYKEQYLQKRRWAYGVSDVPFVLTNLWRRRTELPIGGWLQAARLIEGHFSWAGSSLILAFFGWFPIWFNPEFRESVLAFNFVQIYQQLLTLAMFGMVISLTISRLLLPPRPKVKITSNDIIDWILTPILLPLSNVIFGSFVAIDAQTRLATGRYLGFFRITEKAVIRHKLDH